MQPAGFLKSYKPFCHFRSGYIATGRSDICAIPGLRIETWGTRHGTELSGFCLASVGEKRKNLADLTAWRSSRPFDLGSSKPFGGRVARVKKRPARQELGAPGLASETWDSTALNRRPPPQHQLMSTSSLSNPLITHPFSLQIISPVLPNSFHAAISLHRSRRSPQRREK
jgi:hypothetical protein